MLLQIYLINMGLTGCLFHLVKVGVAAISGDSDKVSHELDKSIESLRRPPLSELGEAITDLFD